MAAAMAGRGRLRAPHADREHVIDVLKNAFVHGLLTKDEFDVRVAQTFASTTYAELAAPTADIPAGLAGARPLPATLGTLLIAGAWVIHSSPEKRSAEPRRVEATPRAGG
jgi:hypothetical protein